MAGPSPAGVSVNIHVSDWESGVRKHAGLLFGLETQLLQSCGDGFGFADPGSRDPGLEEIGRLLWSRLFPECRAGDASTCRSSRPGSRVLHRAPEPSKPPRDVYRCENASVRDEVIADSIFSRRGGEAVNLGEQRVEHLQITGAVKPEVEGSS